MTRDEQFERDVIGDTSGHDCGTSLWLASSARAALSSRSGMVAGVVSAAVAFSTGAPALLLAIPVLFALLFIVKLLNGSTRQEALRQAREMPIYLPEAESFADNGARSVIQRLRQAREAICRVLSDGPRGAGFDLRAAVGAVPRLERDVVVIVTRVEYLARYLAMNPIADLQAEQRRLATQSAKEAEPVPENRRRTEARLRARLDATMKLNEEYDRLLGSADDALGMLEQLPPRMTLLQLGRLESCDGPAAVVRGDIDGFMDGVKQLEAAIAPPDICEVGTRGDASATIGR